METDHDIREIEKSRLAALLDWAFESDASAAPQPDSMDQTEDPQSSETTDKMD
ncbi:hypothetical protein N8633_00755 [bacterium]|jgi:hypothetical protein|nr:hypothetical protein [bacterium]